VLVYLLFFFFFSSRRRHTRSTRDWSSDVCSSDLAAALGQFFGPVGQNVGRLSHEVHAAKDDHAALAIGRGRLAELVAVAAKIARSEERRVGKECRCRGGREKEKERRESVEQ